MFWALSGFRNVLVHVETLFFNTIHAFLILYTSH